MNLGACPLYRRSTQLNTKSTSRSQCSVASRRDPLGNPVTVFNPFETPTVPRQFRYHIMACPRRKLVPAYSAHCWLLPPLLIVDIMCSPPRHQGKQEVASTFRPRGIRNTAHWQPPRSRSPALCILPSARCITSPDSWLLDLGDTIHLLPGTGVAEAGQTSLSFQLGD